MAAVTVDFVARAVPGRPWAIVLVEHGPWADGAIEQNLRRLQDRLYACIDAVVDGQLASRFPESLGKTILIQVDGYDLPGRQVREFFDRFASAVLQIPDYAAALEASSFVRGIAFELNLERLAQ